MTTRFAAHHRDPQPPLPHLIANRTSIAWSPLTTASSSGRSEWLFGRFVFRTRPASDVVSATMQHHRGASRRGSVPHHLGQRAGRNGVPRVHQQGREQHAQPPFRHVGPCFPVMDQQRPQDR